MGLAPRGVVRHPRLDDVLVVYLNELDERWTKATSTKLILTMPGVSMVTTDSRSDWMLLVRIPIPAPGGDQASESN
jgi:hypothetical protein